MPARSKARKRALDILFEAEARSEPLLGLLAERIAAADPPVPDYAAELVRGVHEHAALIDDLLTTHSQGWALERMPAVDRNILRIGVYELLWQNQVPDAVAISEAVTLAFRATGPPAGRSRPRWRPARRSRCRCSSPPARRSR